MVIVFLNHFACVCFPSFLGFEVVSRLARWHVGMLALDMLCWTRYSPSSSLLDSWTPVFEHVGMLTAGPAMLDSMDSCTPHGLMDSSWTPHGLLMDSSSRWSGCNLPIYSIPGNGNTRNKRFIKHLKI